LSQRLRDDLKLALDPVKFAEVVGISPDPWQKQALTWTGKKMALVCARQMGKSTVSAILALHKILYTPKSLVLLVSPSSRQSQELFRKVNDLIKLFPGRVEKVEDNKLSLELRNGSRCVSLPGSEGTIRGYSGASLIICDEASRIPSEIFATVSPMVSVSQGQILLLSTPAGKRGFLFEIMFNDDPSWERITADATECPRITPEFLESEKKLLGDFYFKQEYLIQWLEPEGSLFTLEEIEQAVSHEYEAWNFSIKGGFLCAGKT
jgi:hypothetical protein